MNTLINNPAQTFYVPMFRWPRTKDISYGAVIRPTAPTGPEQKIKSYSPTFDLVNRESP